MPATRRTLAIRDTSSGDGLIQPGGTPENQPSLSTEWRLVLTDKAYTPINEVIGFDAFVYQTGLSKLATTTFTVDLTNTLVDDLTTAEGYIKAYRGGVLRYVGPVISTEETVSRDSQTLAVTSIDVGWYLGKRLAGKNATGDLWSVATNVGTIAKSMIDTTNSTDGETGLSTALYSILGDSLRTYKAGPYRPILDCLAELGSALNGFDWRVLPIENWANNALTGAKVGALHAAPVIGSAQPNAVFEHGTGRNNVLSYTRTRTRDGQANRIYFPGSDYSTVTVRTNPTEDASLVANWKRLDALIQAEITDTTMKSDLADEHLRVRRLPRDLIRFQPNTDPELSGSTPQPFDDYNLGDTVTARFERGGALSFVGDLRIYGFTCSQGDDGFEHIELVLEDEG